MRNLRVADAILLYFYRKMKSHLSPKTFFKSLKFFGEVIAIWPLKIGANRREILIHEVKWWVALLNASGLLLPLILGVYYFRNDSITMTKTLSELTALSEVFINLIQCRIETKNFQAILYEIEYFIEHSNKHEETLLQKYIDRYKYFQLFVGSSFISTALLFTCIPFITSQVLPADTWYPFLIEAFPLRVTLYLAQVLAIFQTGLGITVDFTVATMLWFSAAQVESLDERVSEAVTMIDFRECARRHQQIVLFTNRVKSGIRFLILKTNATMIVAIVCGAFQLINHEPFEVLVRFILMVVGGGLRLYVSAKPADDLMHNSERLAESVFRAALSQNSPSVAKIGLMLASRCQRPIVISVNGIFKAYTLKYYASFLSTSVSYFINLRALLED